MPKIRGNKKLELGDWVFGLGSSKLNNEFHLIYGMEVNERITFEEYWKDPRFQFKKPIKNGSLKRIHGDNIYYQDPENEEWGQLQSLHSTSDGRVNPKHMDKDLSSKFVLISRHFYYFGKNHFLIPEPYRKICGHNARGFSCPSIPVDVGDDFLEYLQKEFIEGVHGDPINWKDYDQIKLIF